MMIRLLSTLALGAAITVPHVDVAAVNTCPTALPTTFTTQYITYETRSVPASSLPTTIPPTEQVHEMNGMEGTEPEEVTTTESPTEIPTDATTTTSPNEGTTEVPTDVPTEVPTSPPTEQVMVDIQVPILHTSPFTPKMILFNPNPQYKTLFTRDTSGHLYYTSNITNSTSGFIGIPPCPSSRDDPQPIYPEPAWDVHHLTNRLVYTCMESKQEEVTVPSTLNIYDVTTRRIKSFNLTEYCDLFKPTSITIDQKKKFDHIYITCTSPAPTSCTNIWRLSRHGSFTQVVDALECPNPRDVRVTGGRIIASCYDPDVINEQTGVRGYGWVTKIDNEQIQPITSSACMNPSQIYYMGQDVYTRCAADGTILRIDPDFLDWEENVFRNTTVFNSSKHCPPSTSLTSFHINSGLNTLYATCTDIRLTNPTTNPKFINGVTTTIVRSRLTNIDDGRKIIQNNEIRTFPLGSTCVPIHQSTNYNIAQDKTDKQDNVDQSSDGVLFVICRSPDSRDPQSGGIITLYHDPVRTIPMKVGTSGQSIHVGNSISGRGNGESSGITPADVMVPSSSSSSSSSQVMGMSVGAGVSVIIFAIIVPLITLMIVIAIYMRRRKSNVRSINHRMEPAITPNPALAVAVDAQV